MCFLRFMQGSFPVKAALAGKWVDVMDICKEHFPVEVVLWD